MKKMKYTKIMKNRLLEFLNEKISEFIEMYKSEEMVSDYDLKLVLSYLISLIENRETDFDIIYLSEKDLSEIPEDLLYFHSLYTFDEELLEICVILNSIEGIETFDSCIGITYQQPGYIKMYYESEKIKNRLKKLFKSIKSEIKVRISELPERLKDRKKILKLEFIWINKDKISNYKKREESALREKLRFLKELSDRLKKEFGIKITEIDIKKFLNKLEENREEINKKFKAG